MNIDEQLEIEIRRDIYKNSYYEFFKDAFLVLNPTDDYSDNWHIKFLCDRLSEETFRIKNKQPREKDIIVNVPFRSAKSLICTVVYPVWSWLIFREMKFICTSYSADLALEHAQLSRNLMESEWFQKHFGDEVILKKDANAKGFYVNENGGFRKSIGMGGAITGSGSDCIIIDDPLNPKKADSDVERANANRYYDTTLYSRLNNPATGIRIVIMQRLNQLDLSGHLMKNRPEDHDHICIPAEISDDLSPKSLSKYYKNGLFWDLRFSKAQLEAYRKALGSYGYSGQLQQTPSPDGGGIIRRSYFDILEPHEVSWNRESEPMTVFVDTAYSDKQMNNNDPSAFLACFKRGSDLYVINCHDKWLDFPKLCNYIINYANANGYNRQSSIKIEGAASGKSVVQQLRSTTSLNVIEIPKPKDDKVTRANAISPILEAKRVKLISGAWNEHALQQWEGFPTASHDDMVDVLIHAVDELLMNSSDGFWFV